MRNKILGLDIGISSVGWGIIDDQGEILAKGVRLFEEPNVNANAERRMFRGSRRLKSRRKMRIKDMRDLLIEYNIISKNQVVNYINPYEARKKGLHNELTNEELAAALLHLAKRRGSSLEVAEEASSDGVNPKAVLARHSKDLKDKFVVELQLEKLAKKGKIRDQENIFKTEDYINEVKQIFKNQNVSIDFINKAIKIIERRRHFSEGPGSIKSPTPYGRWRIVDDELKEEIVNSFTKEQKDKYNLKKFNVTFKDKEYVVFSNGNIINKKPLNLIDLMRGKCSVYLDEFRAPKNSFSALLHNFLNDINNMKIVSEENRSFTKEEKEKAINVIKEKGRLVPNNINGFLKLFNLEITDVIGYRINANEKPLITDFKIYETLLKIFKEENEVLKDEVADKIAEILTNNQVIKEREDKLLPIVNNRKLVSKIAVLTGYSGYHSFSFKAIKLLNKEMFETTENQQQILTKHSLREVEKIHKLELDETLILSSVARRAHRESLKLLTELLKEFGPFERIVIETAREKNSLEQKKNIRDSQKFFRDQNEKALKLIKDAGLSDDEFYSNKVLSKARLYDEQLGKCAYSGVAIDFERMIRDAFYCEIDHIIPRSISQDNSQNNKVLILQEINQLKGNRTPYMYFNSGKVKSSYPINNYNAYKDFVLNNPNYKKNPRKRKNLLNEEDITKFDSLEEFTKRNLVDTSYAARSLMTTIKNYFKANDINTKVHTIRGKQTSMFRSRARALWNQEHRHVSVELNPFNKDRNQYRHHAIDALIIAALSNHKTFKYLFELEPTKKESFVTKTSTGEVFIPDPIKDERLMKLLKSIGEIEDAQIRFSWKIDRKINRSFSNQTIYSTRNYEGEEYVIFTYKNIYEKTSDELSNILEKNQEKLLVYQHDRETYKLILKAFSQYKHEKYPLKAYMEEHGKIRKNGVGPFVTNLKYRHRKLGEHIDITKPQTKNKKEVLLTISPYRIDIYKNKKNVYKFVTVRYADFSLDEKGYFINKDLYNRKLKDKKIDNTFEFLFSFNRNEIFEMKVKNKNIERYRFITISNDKNNIVELKSIEQFDEKRVFASIGRNTELINKYAVSPAGRINKIAKEELTLVR